MGLHLRTRIRTHRDPLDLGFPDFVLHSKGRNQLPLNDLPRLHALPILPHLTLDLEYSLDRPNP